MAVEQTPTHRRVQRVRIPNRWLRVGDENAGNIAPWAGLLTTGAPRLHPDPTELVLAYGTSEPYRPFPVQVLLVLARGSSMPTRDHVKAIRHWWERSVRSLPMPGRSPQSAGYLAERVTEYAHWLTRSAESELREPGELGVQLALVRYAAGRLKAHAKAPEVFLDILAFNRTLLHPWRRFADWLENTHRVRVGCDWVTPPADNLSLLSVRTRVASGPPLEVFRLSELETLVVAPQGQSALGCQVHRRPQDASIVDTLQQQRTAVRALWERVRPLKQRKDALVVYERVLREVGGLAPSTVARYTKRVRYVLGHLRRFPRSVRAPVLVDCMLATTPRQRQVLRAAWNAFAAVGDATGAWTSCRYTSLDDAKVAGFDLSRPWPAATLADVRCVVAEYGAAVVHRATWGDVAMSPGGRWVLRVGTRGAAPPLAPSQESSEALKRLARWACRVRANRLVDLAPHVAAPVVPIRPRGNVRASRGLLKLMVPA